jgi:hypothetical protein
VSITITEQCAPALRAANATPCAALPALTVHQLCRRQLADDVVRAADLERANRLQRFELQIQIRFDLDQRCANGGAVDGGCRITDGRERYLSI